MRPINTATGKKWSEVNASRMHREIRATAQAALTARDQSRGIPKNGQVYAADSGGHFGVDRHLAGLKHTGRDLRLLTQKHWDIFCRTPKDEGAYVSILAEADNKTERKLMAARTKAAPDVEVKLPQPAKPKSGGK